LIFELLPLDNACYAKKKIDYWTGMVNCCDYKNDGAVRLSQANYFDFQDFLFYFIEFVDNSD